MTTFPLEDLTAELLIDGTWTPTDVLQRDPIVIRRGLAGESARVDPSTCTLTLDNRSGDWSPRNPTGAHYGLIGRNTPIRVRANDGAVYEHYAVLHAGPGSAITTPDHSSLDIVGDIDLRMELEPDSWAPTGGLRWLAWKGDEDAISWAWYLAGNSDPSAAGADSGELVFLWTTAGVWGGGAIVSTTVVPPDSGRLAIRVTLDVNNGAAGHDVRFYTADAIDGSWTQLGSTVTTGGVTSIYSGSGQVGIGDCAALPTLGDPIAAKMYAFEIRDGIGGTTVASPDFTAVEPGIPTFDDAQGRTWTGAVIYDPNARFYGEISTWPQVADQSGSDITVPIVASGPLRRLGQGAAAVQSTMFRGISLHADDLVAYWPCEDGEDATALASAIPGGPPMTLNGATDLASFSDFDCSNPIPVADVGAWTGQVPYYDASAHTGQVRFLLAVPDGGVSGNATLCRFFTPDPTIPRWDIDVSTAGELRLRGLAADGAEVITSGYVAFDVNGRLLRVSAEITSTGSWRLATLEVGQSDTWTEDTGTEAYSEVFDRITHVVINPGGGLTGDGVAIGHVSVQSAISPPADLDAELSAFAGETAAARVARLGIQEGVLVQVVGDVNKSVAMGPQRPLTLVQLLTECVEADLGYLYEPRGFLGLAYRPHGDLYNQSTVLELDFATNDLTGFDPVEDDQHIRNDVTVTRVDGGSARAEDTTGPLSTAAPPDGVGRYTDDVTVNVGYDHDLPHQAGWRLHLGTIDEPRYPVLGVNLARDVFTSDVGDRITTSTQALDVGDKVAVINPPDWAPPPDDIAQLAVGFTETLTKFEWRIDFNCAPASGWDVGVYGDDDGPGDARYSSTGTVLGEALDTTETGVDITIPTGALWTAEDQPFDIWVGGERMTVTAVSGSSSPQTLTVTRSVNGVVKTHATGAAVRLFKPAVYAL